MVDHSIDFEAVRTNWLNNIAAESRLWLSHIDKRADEIRELYSDNKFPTFEQPELLFHIFAFLNWLAHIDFRTPDHIQETNHPKHKDMISWLSGVTGWPLDVCEAFWFCLRNPTMHTGRTSIFSDYRRKSHHKFKLYADLIPQIDTDPLEYQPDEYKPTNETDGWMAVTDPMDLNKLEVSFFYKGLRRKLDQVSQEVYSGVEKASSAELQKLIHLNLTSFGFRFG